MWRSHFNSECQNHMFWNAKAKAIMTYFRHNSFFFSFISELKTDIYWWSGRWQTGRWQAERRRGKSHWCWDNIKCFLLTYLVLLYVCLKLKVEVFIVSVHGLEFKRSECTSYYNIMTVKFRKICIEKYMTMSLIHYFILHTWR